jgi:hypothetical protein
MKTKIKIEEDIRIPAASHVSQIPISCRLDLTKLCD